MVRGPAPKIVPFRTEQPTRSLVSTVDGPRAEAANRPRVIECTLQKDAAAQDLAVLLTRVEKAKGPDRQLDGALVAALQGGSSPSQPICALTGSLDAAMGLMRSVLPAWAIEACRFSRATDARVAIWPEGLRPECCHEAWGATLELAILAAVLKALAADAPRTVTPGVDWNVDDARS